MKFEEALAGVTRLYLDTAPVIYLVERNPQFFDQVRGVFQKVDEGQLTVVASPITLAECLVGAYRMKHAEAATTFFECLTQEGTDFVQISVAIADRAAQLRVKYNLDLTDAFQIATALEAGCEAFLTNDIQLKRVTEVTILAVSDLEV
ncbi:MAG: type II toxin-antitoxin system VapC family toxin [Leptolyngbyaceae cyanobacterium RM2_2_4]|nr:type II toxin-antitoxin system VapC family toxin [Leptolyngbyaceae cyanobacterium SM1_4_3]NJO50524.1 type II toxin-antitoxin system VapC family toxin [Leptolyngbyaceae cyanobacterium RM2_2_4]